ncbi:MAG: outer membrane protein assembly factor BamD [Candidatus Binatia bacterium]
MRRRSIALLILVALAACSTKKPIAPADVLWRQGNQGYDDEAWEYAIDNYKALLDQHPFDANVEEAELKVAMSYFFARRYAEAIAAFGDFERMHPTSADRLAMVEYHLGLSYLAQGSTSDRDQDSTTNALQYFRNLGERFPDSPWAEKAKLRTKECREALASHERDVAAYYLRHGNLAAGESRLRLLLTDYPDMDATADALVTFAHAYERRDEPDGAQLALATVVRHHPGTPEAARAREQLGDASGATQGPDPLPQLVERLARVSAQASRRQIPASVSAYPNTPPSGGY